MKRSLTSKPIVTRVIPFVMPASCFGFIASGNEQSYVEGFNSNVSTGPALLLPPEDWGFPASQIFLGSQFDVVDRVAFYALNPVDCFGMDEFYIDEQFAPEPGTFGLAALGSADWRSIAAAGHSRQT